MGPKMDNITYSYDEARELIQDGDIIFLRANKKSPLLSRIISYITKSPYHHVAMAFWLYTDSGKEKRLFMLEAYGIGRRVTPLSLYIDRDFDIIRMKNTPKWAEIESLALEPVGRVPYSYMSLISMAIEEILGKKARDYNGEVCSEMSAKLLIKAGYNKPLKGLITPRDLAKDLLANGEELVLQIRKSTT